MLAFLNSLNRPLCELKTSTLTQIRLKLEQSPIFAAECAPPAIRGALVMMWQMWTAFGCLISAQQIQ